MDARLRGFEEPYNIPTSAVEQDREHSYRDEKQEPHVGIKRSVFVTGKKIGIMYIGTKAAAPDSSRSGEENEHSTLREEKNSIAIRRRDSVVNIKYT